MYINPQTFTTHPEKTATEKEMQSYLFLEENGVEYVRAEHDEAHTIELCEEIEKYRDIAKAMGVAGTESMSQDEYRKAAVEAVKQLAADVGIPADLKAIVKDEDVQFLAESAYADACRPGNPRDTSVEEIAALYRSLM